VKDQHQGGNGVPTIAYEDIVTETSRPTLVLAGPGAGKTHLLGDRVRRLLDAGVDSDTITLLTFGRDATQNMRNKLLDPQGGFGLSYKQMPHIATLHALGFEIVNRNPRAVGLRKADLNVQPEATVASLLFRDAAFSVGLSAEDATAARSCKARGNCSSDSADQRCRVCSAYWAIMSKCNCLDFDDQVLFACRILETNADLLEEYRSRCRHLLVDEYQDINAAQFRLIRLLSEKSAGGLFAVGDDAQSIYGFRGSTPEFILRFSEDFPGAWSPPLAFSRRCPECILGRAQTVLDGHYPEWTGAQDLEYLACEGDEPRVWRVPTADAEAQWTARVARQAVGEHKTVLVLAPKSAFFPRLSRVLSQYGVAHDCQEDLLPDAVTRRLSVGWQLLEWLTNTGDNFLTRLALEAVVDHGVAKVAGAAKGQRCKTETIARRVGVEAEIASLWNSVSTSSGLMQTLETQPSLSGELRLARDVLVGLRESCANYKNDKAGDFSKRLALASGWTKPDTFGGDLLLLRNELKRSKPPGFSNVQLMTLRKAKGLEADVVVMVGLEDDILPGSATDLEEQARLFYVGMTRAKKALYLLHSYRRPRDVSFGAEICDKPRSRFLDALGIPSVYRKDKAKTA
jgi:superfamily I DNA/RNA helicase